MQPDIIQLLVSIMHIESKCRLTKHTTVHYDNDATNPQAYNGIMGRTKNRMAMGANTRG